MADQLSHSNPHGSYPYILDSSELSLDTDKHPEQQNPSQAHAQQHQNQAQMSPPNSAGPASSTLMYHPYAHPQHSSYPSSMHQSSPTPHMSQACPLTLDPAHLRPSSVGPSRNRILTRRQTRAAASHEYLGTPQEQQQHRQQFDAGFDIYGGNDGSPRAQTSSAFHHTGPQYSDPHINLSDLNVGQLTMPDMSPQHPDTPASAASSSNYSHYGFTPYPSSRHSRSSSNATHPRSTSPAASVVSAATSLSSGSTRKRAQSRPPVSSGSAGCISVSSFTSTSTPADVPVVKPKRRLQNKQRKEICQYYNDHPNKRQEDIANKWGVERSTVSKILKNKNRWLAVLDDGDDTHVAKQRPAKFAFVEDKMTVWLKECRDSGTLITDAMIRNKARECARTEGIFDDKFKASAGWVENYKHRVGIKKGIWVGRDPGLYDDTDDRSEYDISPYVYETREFNIQRMTSMVEAERERASQLGDGLDMSVEIPDHLSLEPSPFTIAESGRWPSSLNGLTFGDSESMDTSPVTGLSNSAKEAPPNPKPTSLTAELQHHYVAARATWEANGGGTTSSAVSGSPPVSPHEASKAISTVLRFIDAQKPDFLSEQERNIITDVKHHIWLSVVQSQPVPTSVIASAPPITKSTTSCTTGNTHTPSVEVVPGAEILSVQGS